MLNPLAGDMRRNFRILQREVRGLHHILHHLRRIDAALDRTVKLELHRLDERQRAEQQALGVVVVVVGEENTDVLHPCLERFTAEWHDARARVHHQPMILGKALARDAQARRVATVGYLVAGCDRDTATGTVERDFHGNVPFSRLIAI